jgi:flagellin
MPQIINTNLPSLNAQRNLNKSQNAQNTALQRLSSGLRVNSARDDAAGLAISTRFDTQVRGLNVAIRNANDGVSLAQVAEGALGAMTDNLQRIRELALQSANDTNTDIDREALDAEVQQLLSEIKAVSENANFNGRKLLDGSFTTATFQTGANEGETISFGIAKATVDSLGTAVTNGISSDVAGNTASDLAAGDLVINGIAVGASTSADDTSSMTLASASAIAKVAAINRVSDQSGVTATINKNFVGGQLIGASGAGATITINGISVNVTLSGSTADVRNAQMAAAINAVAGQTGVRAEIAEDDDGGINLIADDGRNIQLVNAGGNAGVAASGSYAGSYTLTSKDGAAIDITSNSGDIRAHAGFEVAEYSGTNSGVIAAGGTVGAAGLTAMAEGDLVINEVPVGATDLTMDTASTSLAASSAIAKAAAINKVSEKTGVTAEVIATRIVSTAVTAVAATISINGAATLAISAQANVGLQVQAIVDAVNSIAGQTGVRAEVLDGDQYQLIADDGRNIQINIGGAGGGVATGVTAGGVSLKGAGTIELATNTGDIGNSGFTVGDYGGAEEGSLIEDMDITSVENALKALKSVDNALASINVQRARLGAIQNRFESSISNQAIAQENLSAATSRIKDADFAAETAALSRAQVLQQAGISILGQANALPQQVLSLLQG